MTARLYSICLATSIDPDNGPQLCSLLKPKQLYGCKPRGHNQAEALSFLVAATSVVYLWDARELSVFVGLRWAIEG